jgi:pimeloyl-ACP methyl ester carboxylesterase
VAPDLDTLEVEGHDVLVATAGTGPAVLYLHGLCDIHAAAAPDHLTPFLSGLAGSCRLVCPALPGYPGSSLLGRFHEIEDYVFHVADVLGRLGLGDAPLPVVGHSIGGWLAAELALRRPELVARLVLLAPLGAHVAGLAVPPAFGALAPRGLGGLDEPRRLLFADPDGAVATEQLPDAMAEDQQLRWFGGLAGAAALGWKAPHFQSRRLTRRLPRISAPSLLVFGRDDRLVPEPMRRAWAEGLAGAEPLEVDEAGHALALERPELWQTVAAYVGESWR